jgi:hypothetical protein
MPAVLRASCFIRRTYVRFPLDDRLGFALFDLPVLVATDINSLLCQLIHRSGTTG